MTNTQTTRTKNNHYFRAVLTALAMLAAMLVASGVALAATTSFSNSSPIQMADNSPTNPYPSRINVQGVSGNISDLNLKLSGFTHTNTDDVDVLLVGPKGQKALLMSDVGVNKDVNDVNLTLDDEAAISLPDDSVTPITTDAYKPTQGIAEGTSSPVPANFPSPAPSGPYATNLSAFDGTDPNGAWDLYVIDDDNNFQSGQFAGGWSLDITTGSTPPPDPQPGPQPDTTAPRVTSTVPALRATGVSPTANVSATFSEEMQASTINGATFKLFKKGSTTKLEATVSYSATTDTATLDPAGSLKNGVTYKAVVTTGAKDLAGNALDQNPTHSGLQQKAWTFKTK